MPMNPANYPDDWPAIAYSIKAAGGWQCQNCGMQCRRPGEPFDTHRRTLTVAHWHHDTQAAEVFVVALCAGCHNRHDAKYRANNRRRKAREVGRRAGQMELNLSGKKEATSATS